MTCPHQGDPISGALRKCPFLHELSEKHGEQYARKIAVNPTCPVSHHRAKPLLEEVDDYSRTLKLFHGPQGVVPLAKVMAPEMQATFPDQPSDLCFNTQPTGAGKCPGRASPAAVLASAPFASMSTAFGNHWPNFGDFFNKKDSHKQPRPSSTSHEHLRKPEPQPKPKPQPRSNPYSSISSTSSISPGSSISPSGGTCPLRKVLGPFAGVVFNKHGHIQCPDAIIKARAALAATQPVRSLRPQHLGVKLLAVAATTAALNVPCGAWREHTEKFSVGWFMAVHATIPFIAMLRKAVIMPKYAIIFTIAAAVAGQAMGARMERQRLQEASLKSPAQQQPVRAKVRVAKLHAPAMACLSMTSGPAVRSPSWRTNGSAAATPHISVSQNSFETVKGRAARLLGSSIPGGESLAWLPTAVSVR